jgi:hypothetical protein
VVNGSFPCELSHSDTILIKNEWWQNPIISNLQPLGEMITSGVETGRRDHLRLNMNYGVSSTRRFFGAGVAVGVELVDSKAPISNAAPCGLLVPL